MVFTADVRSELDELWKRVEEIERKIGEIEKNMKSSAQISILISVDISTQLSRLFTLARMFPELKEEQRVAELIDFLKRTKESHDSLLSRLEGFSREVAEIYSEAYLKLPINSLLIIWHMVGGGLRAFLDILVKALSLNCLNLVDERMVKEHYGLEGVKILREAKKLAKNSQSIDAGQ